MAIRCPALRHLPRRGDRPRLADVSVSDLAVRAHSRPFLLWAPVVAYMALIFVASSISQPVPAGIELPDKPIHACEYGVLAALFVRAITGGWRTAMTKWTILAAVAFATLYGVTDEFHQSFVPGRDVEALDVVADACGATLAASALYAWGMIRHSR